MRDFLFLVLIGLAGYGLPVGGYGLYLSHLQSQPITNMKVLEQVEPGNHYVAIGEGYFYPGFVYEYEQSRFINRDDQQGTLTYAIVPYISASQLQAAEAGSAIEPTIFAKFPLSIHSRNLDQFEEQLNYYTSMPLKGYTNETPSEKILEFTVSAARVWDWFFEEPVTQRLSPGDRARFNEFPNFTVSSSAVVVDVDEFTPPLSEHLMWFLAGLFSAIIFLVWWGKTNFAAKDKASTTGLS